MGKVLLGSLRIQIQGYILAQNVPFLSDTISLISSFSYTLQNVRYLTFCKVILKSTSTFPRFSYYDGNHG